MQIYGEITRIESYRDSDDELHHAVYVTYEYEGNMYEDVRINSYSSRMSKGKKFPCIVTPMIHGGFR